MSVNLIRVLNSVLVSYILYFVLFLIFKSFGISFESAIELLGKMWAI